jgi:mannose-1-phosphate guanylyltransferase/mannose-6-phosphate isomerase
VLIAVILSGGAGTRLWPVSREMHPKPFIKLSDGQSLLQKTLDRVLKLTGIVEVVTVTNREFYFKTKEEYSVLGNDSIPMSFLLEPVGRNTAPAIGMAALYALQKYGPESVLLILPADHLIEEQEFFDQAVISAYAAAKNNKLVTFGIRPVFAETGFGYIKVNSSYNEQSICNVEKFIEKPSLETANEYVLSSSYLWNAGIFCFKTESIITQFQILTPDMFQQLSQCWDVSKKLCFQI